MEEDQDSHRFSKISHYILLVLLLLSTSTSATATAIAKAEGDANEVGPPKANPIPPSAAGYWIKFKALIHQQQLLPLPLPLPSFLFTPTPSPSPTPSSDFRQDEDETKATSDGDGGGGGGGGKVKEAVAKSLQQGIETLHDSAKSAADLTKDKIKETLSPHPHPHPHPEL